MLATGRVTHAALAQFAIASSGELNMRMTALPKTVFSTTLHEPLPWRNTRLVQTRAEQEIATLRQQDGAPLRSIGSISLVKSMIRFQLVDRLRLMIFPVVLGTAGREPIFAGYEKTSLELISSRILDSASLCWNTGRASKTSFNPDFMSAQFLRHTCPCNESHRKQRQNRDWRPSLLWLLGAPPDSPIFRSDHLG
jgi:dihydrofolate reductase